MSENLFILTLQIYWNSKTLVLLNVRSKQFAKSYLSVGLYKILIRTGLDLGRKISIKILSVLMQKLGFPLYKIEFLTKQATHPPLRNRSDLTRLYPSISISLLKTVLPSLVSLNPITVVFVSLAMQSISSILDRRLFIFKWMKYMPHFWNMFHASLPTTDEESRW